MPGAPTQDLVWLTQSNCVLLQAVVPLHLSATDMHRVDVLKLCRGTGMCQAVYIPYYIDYTESQATGDGKRYISTFLAAFIMKRLVADTVS